MLALLAGLALLKAGTVAVGQPFEFGNPEWTGRCRALTMLEREVDGGTRAPGEVSVLLLELQFEEEKLKSRLRVATFLLSLLFLLVPISSCC